MERRSFSRLGERIVENSPSGDLLSTNEEYPCTLAIAKVEATYKFFFAADFGRALANAIVALWIRLAF